MPLTREFKGLVVDMARKDPEFRKGLLRNAIELVFEGDLVAGIETNASLSDNSIH